VAEPDQGWASWLDQVRQHQPDTPIPPDAPTATPPAQPVGSGSRDSVPISVSSDAPPAAAPDVQHVAAPAGPAAIAAAYTASAATLADSAVPMVTAPPPVSSVFSDSAGVQPLPAMPIVGSDSGALSTSLTEYASYGWYVVPSIGNDPTYADGSTGDGGSEWGFADAGYASDWFFFA